MPVSSPLTEKEQSGTLFRTAVLVLLFLLLCLALGRVVTPRMLSGWDLFPQYYLVHSMVENLEQGSIFGYDHHWFGGYTSFGFYGFLPYYCVAQVYRFVFVPLYGSSHDSLALTLNVFLYLLPSLQLAAFGLLGRGLLGRGYGYWSMLAGFLCLLEGGYVNAAPFHIFSNLLFGHFAFSFSLLLLTLVIGTLGLMRRGEKPWLWGLASGALISAVICSHPLTAVFLAFYGMFLFFWHRKTAALSVAAVFSGGFLLSLPWSFQFLRNLWLSRSQTLGPSDFDPILTLFPRLHLLKSCLENWEPFAWLNLPYTGLFLLACFAAGTAALVQKRGLFLVSVFTLTLVLFPRDVLIHLLPLPLHYYRFIAVLFVIFIPICAFGFAELNRVVGARENRLGRLIGAGLLGLSFGLALFSSLRVDYRGGPAPLPYLQQAYELSSRTCGFQDARSFPAPLSSSPSFRSVQSVLAAYEESPPEGRVAIEPSTKEKDRVGSPFVLHTLFPLLFKQEVLPGLLAESSPAAPIQIALLGLLGDGMIWGNTGPLIRSTETADLIEGLRHYGVSDLILTTKEAEDAVSQEFGESAKVFGDRSYAWFRLQQPYPRVSSLEHPPLLFVEAGGRSFQEFGSQYFLRGFGQTREIVFSPRDLSEIPPHELKRFSGFVVSLSEGKLTEGSSEIAALEPLEKPMVLLGPDAYPSSVRRERTTLFPIRNRVEIFPTKNHFNRFLRLISRIDAESSAPVSKLSYSGSEIAFQSDGPVLLRFGYHPRWRSESEVYQTTAGLMFVFADGKTALTFE